MADDLAERLLAFLERYEGKPVEWGADDCTASAALWVRECGHEVRTLPYASRDEAHALIEEFGSLANLWDWALVDSGICERYERPPRLGDVAIVDTRQMGQIGVICGSGGICGWRKHNGFWWFTPRSYVKVWAIS